MAAVSNAPLDAMDTREDSSANLTTRVISGPSILIEEPGKVEAKDDTSKPPEVVVGTRRNANGTIGSVFSGNKIRHLKKEDGQPFWRKDIQHDFLRAVFGDTTPCFTEVDGTTGHTFAEVFIGAMQRSSKTSKVLKDKLLNEKEQAERMAMICLLVNVGRMNTTLNFFAEMRAQLRTYHAIPSLQVEEDRDSPYKGLQDAPRLKSILKGACEDTDEPRTIEKVKSASIPRTNIVNLIFVLSQDVQKVSEIHFDGKLDFFELFIPSDVSSPSRARAFLWLMWYYMQSDFTKESIMSNPFGPGHPPQDDPEGLPVKIPELVTLSAEDAALENVDTPEELAFGEERRLARQRLLLEVDETNPPTVKKTAGPSPARSEVGRTRENSPDGTPSFSRPRKSNLDTVEKVSSSIRLNLKPSKPGELLPAPTAFNHSSFASGAQTSRRSRPETSHQKAVNLNRRMHIDKILHENWTKDTRAIRQKRKHDGLGPLYRKMKRIYYLPDSYDSENEEQSIGPGGLTPNMYTIGLDEEDDFGADAHHYRKILARAMRRIDRDEDGRSTIRVGADTNNFTQINGHIRSTSRIKNEPNATKGTQPGPVLRSGEGPDVDDMELLGDEDDDGEDGNEGEDRNENDSGDETDGDETEDDFSHADPYAGVR